MPLSPWLTPLRNARLRLLLLLVIGGLVSVLRGQDNNWDLRNYHLYLPFSMLGGRLGTDLMPAGPQSAFNPLLDVPYYLLAVSWLPDWPRLVAFLAGLPFGLMAFLTLECCTSLKHELPGATPERTEMPGAAALVAALFGISGSTGWSEVGTTYGDIPVAVLVLAGLLAPLRALDSAAAPGRWRGATLLAGLCLGLAAGLKPTAVLYAPALGIALLVGAGAAGLGWRQALTGFFIFCVGWVLAFGAAFGWWGWAVFQRYGNPVFPFMNQVFASPWGLPVSMEDSRFLPRSALQAIAYPFFWLRGQPFVVSETGVGDPRFALAWLAVMALGLMATWRWLVGHRLAEGRLVLLPGTALFLAFVVIAFVIWEIQFSILRYIIALEALTGAVLLVAAGAFGRRWAKRFLSGFVVLTITVVLVSEKQNWGRLRQYGARVIEVQASALPDGAVVVTASRPVAFVLPFLQGRNLAFVGLVDVPRGTRLWDETWQIVRSGRPVYAVLDPAQSDSISNTRAFGLRLDEATCSVIVSNLRAGLQLCPARLD
jgi:hypothetical protein